MTALYWRMMRFAFALFLVGCGLENGGLENGPSTDDGGITPDTSVMDQTVGDTTSMDVVNEPGPPQPCSQDAGACVAAIPAGWSLVAYAANRATGCPSNYQTDDVVTAPVAGAGSCDCGCSVGTQPVCDVGSIAFKTGDLNDTLCMGGGVTINVNGPGCTSGGGTVAAHVLGNVIAPSGGTCTAPTIADKTKVTSTAARACRVPPQCQEEFCNGSVPAGFQACIAKSPSQVCPPGWNVAAPNVVGNDVTLSCSGCTCQINQTSTCTNAKVDFFKDNQCNGSPDSTVVVDGTCKVPSGVGQNVDHFKYSATLTTVCQGAGPKTPAVDVANPVTICCK